MQSNMKKLLLLVLAISLTSCTAYMEAINEYNNSPAGQEQLRQRFVLDSIRASRSVYPFRYGFDYYRATNTYPLFYHYNRPRVVIRREVKPRRRVNVRTPRRRNDNRYRNPRNNGRTTRVVPRSRRSNQ